MAITFNTLNQDAPIFKELAKAPSWWERFKNDPSLYIEIRKDNQVNVYFEGGSVARIHYCSKHKKLQVFTHHKYLSNPEPIEGHTYVECSNEINDRCDEIIQNVKKEYSQKHAINGVVQKEKWSEKYIQGTLIVNSREFHLDSEFAYIDKDSDNRIDLVRCDDGQVTFVELKRIDDGRMLHETDENPEVVFQMQRYKEFIAKYSDELLAYYQRVYDIKVKLGLPVPESRPMSINKEPVLLVFDRWVKETPGREEHRRRLYDILDRESIRYYVKKEIKE